jgi:hypothetical protein
MSSEELGIVFLLFEFNEIVKLAHRVLYPSIPHSLGHVRANTVATSFSSLIKNFALAGFGHGHARVTDTLIS